MTDPAPSAQPDPYARTTPAAELTAPPGTDPSTPWIWAILVIPIVQFLPIFLIDWNAFIVASITDTTGLGATAALFSPGYVALIAVGWIGTALLIWFAYLDWKELKRRGVPQPFHWAWMFLVLAVSYAVYPIGRAVVAKRRTGRGLEVMWITIATLVAGLVAGVVLSIVLVQLVIANLDLVTFGP
jgi:hypothetical protein